MLLILNNLTLYARLAGQGIAYFACGRWRGASHLPRRACRIPEDFFGLCVANAPDPASDDYVIARLNELGLRHVRLDFTYTDRQAYTERFLDRLLTERFRVCLHLVQPREEARAMLRLPKPGQGRPEAAERWRAFVGEMLDQYGRRMELIEIGATCNRRKWSGYSPAAFFAAWQIAWEEARGRNLTIAGPNITDFEPVYNAGWLGCLRRSRMPPSAHTDNLFVERCTEPEAFDHKIAGKRLARLLRFNLVRKAQLLSDIGAWAGVPTLICAHVSWSLRRIARLLEDVEEKQADYLARYACLAAASSAFSRVYWGPLIGQREGLIDDGTSEYPEIPHVTYYEQARGALKDYRLRPAFQAFQTVIRLLPGATFQRRLPTGQGLEILEFALNAECSEIRGQRSEVSNQQSAKILHAVWTTDGHCAGADECYSPELLAQAEIYSRDGQQLKHPPRMFSESPVFLVWATDGRRTPEGGTSNAERRPARNASHSDAGGMQNVESGIRHPASGVRRPIPGFRFARQSGWDFDVVRPETNEGRWSGVYLAEAGGERVDIQALIALLGEVQRTDAGTEKQTSNIQHPTSNSEPKTKNEEQRTKNYAVLRILRAARNFVWSTSAPWNAERQIVIKAFKRRGAFRRLSWPTPWPSLGRRAVGTLAGARAQAGRLDCGKPDKALRSWNGAQELLRRGLATPTPLGCLLPTKDAENATTSARWNRAKWSLGARSADATSYYICEMFGAAWSAREVFNAFSAGATEFQGHSAGAWYEALALFLQKLHTRGVYFRDLSAGNLLARDGSGGELEFALIDTARARFFPGSLRLRLRLCDLMRICHPLYWPGRRIFVEQYLAHNGRRFRWWLKIPFLYYDGKHWLKNRWKRWL